MTRIEFVYFEAGGGHRSAANALKAVIEQQGRDWDVRLMNLQEVLDPLDIFRKYTRIRMEDVYNLLLKKGWTLGSPQMLVAMHALIRLYHRAQVRLLKEYWAQSKPAMVVSLVPNFNRAMCESLRAVNASTPYVTILTDFADYPPHFWIEQQEQYLICGTEKAVEQARALGHAEDRVFATSGMILRPKFYDPVAGDRRAERRKLGLDPDLPTGLVLFGGEGSHWMLKIPRMVAASGLKLQLISICGRNAKLKSRLENMQPGFPMRVEGFTTEIPYFMHLSDFFIGKPGPGSISEALAMKLPVMLERNAWTLPQERYNADWVLEKQVGVVLRSFHETEAGLRELLEPANFARFRANAAAITNRAVFEIPEILDGVLRRESPGSQ